MRCRAYFVGTLALVGAVAGLCLSPSAGVAAGRWTSPQRLTAGLAAGTPTLGFDGRGAALATWATAGGAGRRSASRAPTRVAFGPSGTAPNIGGETIEGLPPAPVIDRSGGVVAIEQRRVRPACGLGTIFDVTPRFGRVNGTFARPRGGWRIFSHTEPPAVALAGNTRGVAVVAWLQLRRDAHGCVNREDVRVAVRPPGGTFGAPVTLARGGSFATIAASVSADGRLLVAWRHGPAIETRTRPARGPWGPTRPINVGGVDSFAATLASNGVTYLIWTQTPSHGPVHVGRVVGAAVRSAHATRFSTRILERGTWPTALIDRPERRAVRLARSHDRLIAAWTSSAGNHLQVLTATATGSRFAAARRATPRGQDFALGALALNTAGRPALALTANASDMPSGPFVALGATDGTFATPAAVGPGGSRINGEALAFSPRTGQPTLVWTQFKTVFASTRTP